MRTHLKAGALLGTLTMATATLVTTTAGSAAAVPPDFLNVLADWQMNEPAEAIVMLDDGPQDIDVTFSQDDINTGFTFDGAVGYQWERYPPNQPPAQPQRVIQIEDTQNGSSTALDPLGGSFEVEVRFKTDENFGNITQKGQAATRGGQWKIQNPQGRPSCLFKGSITRGSVRARTAINDDEWHILECVKTPSYVELRIDGVRIGRKNGNVGTVNNTTPMVIGGKINCDQVDTTCDYFTGEIDYVKLTRE